ncbi:MAG TPA: SRPBCC domain-containing protein [Terracidiphilus sp.]|nr:SRPBCC domain-containing protein [Terracidiphilus sp.]
MSTLAPELKHHRRRTNSGEVLLQDSPYTICASIRVRAETRRLFQALTSPEYLEAWMCIPDAATRWPLVATHGLSGFLIESFDLDSDWIRILAAYTAFRRRRLSIHWSTERKHQIRESAVAMRLHGDFEYSVLSLCHAGFGSFDEVAWHRQLWAASLGRLAKLF